MSLLIYPCPHVFFSGHVHIVACCKYVIINLLMCQAVEITCRKCWSHFSLSMCFQGQSSWIPWYLDLLASIDSLPLFHVPYSPLLRSSSLALLPRWCLTHVFLVCPPWSLPCSFCFASLQVAHVYAWPYSWDILLLHDLWFFCRAWLSNLSLNLTKCAFGHPFKLPTLIFA